MVSNPPAYDTSAIRNLLTSAFSAGEMQRFCHDTDFLRAVWSDFGPNPSMDLMVSSVIDFCERRLLMAELLAAVRAFNPRMYARFESYFGSQAAASPPQPAPFSMPVDAGRVIQGQLGYYQITESAPLSSGRDSQIWVGADGRGQLVCIKAYYPYVTASSSWKSFYTEVSSNRVLQHPNILAILDYGLATANGSPFLVLPLCRGGSLRTLLDSRGFIHETLFLPILQQMASAVDFAHSRGIIHGDIKPENILFPRDASFACLSDFGTARFFGVREHITDPNPGAGTSSYLSPEQVRQSGQTELSDVYSLAVVAYEALTGRLPFDTTKSAYEQMVQKVTGEVLDPIQANYRVGPAARAALLAGLSVDNRDRPQSAAEFYDMFQGKALPDRPHKPPAPPASPQPKKRKGWLRALFKD